MGASVARLDAKGRILLPREIRRILGLRPGDAIALELNGLIVSCAKVPNPFDKLAEQAEEEHRTGKTRELRDIIRSRDLSRAK